MCFGCMHTDTGDASQGACVLLGAGDQQVVCLGATTQLLLTVWPCCSAFASIERGAECWTEADTPLTSAHMNLQRACMHGQSNKRQVLMVCGHTTAATSMQRQRQALGSPTNARRSVTQQQQAQLVVVPTPATPPTPGTNSPTLC